MGTSSASNSHCVHSPDSQVTRVAPSLPYISAFDESSYLSIHKHLFSIVCVTKIKKKLSPRGSWSSGSNEYTQQRS